MKVMKWGIVVVLVLLIIVSVSIYGYLRSTLPDYTGTYQVPGLKSEVEVIRDSFGMPHIFADNDEDGYFAMGYSQAQDRLFQMDLARRAGAGRLSEILGSSLLNVDKLFRTLNSPMPIEGWQGKLSPEGLNSLKAFAAGVNYYLENDDRPLPIEFQILGYKPEPWQVTDSIAIMLYVAWTSNYAFKTELLHAAIIEKVGEDLAKALFIDYPSGFPAIIPEGENPIPDIGLGYLKTLHYASNFLGFNNGGASNSWVVGPQKSKSGHALFANDPHLNLTVPSIWYEGHLSVPGMNVSGALVAGMPFIIGGANEHVAWGVTNSHHDDADFFLEKLHPDNKDLYLFKGKWEKMKIVKTSIRVKGAKTVDYEIKVTRHGSIIDDLNKHKTPYGHAVAMRWAQVDFPKAFRGYWLVNRAKSVKDIEEAAGFAKSGQNWVYADKNGDIGFYFLGGIPKRRNFTGELPVPGWEGKYEWDGYVPNDEQPHLRNPKQGFIVNANNKIEPEGYPHIITKYYATPDRFMRIQELLRAKEKFGPEDFETMLDDVLIVMARDWVPLIVTSLQDRQLSNMESSALERLQQWDFGSRKNQIEASIFNVFLNYLPENTFKNRLGQDLYVYYLTGDKNIPFNVLREIIKKGGSPWFDNPDTPEIEVMNDVLAKSFKDSVRYLEKNLGDDIQKWQWGKLHTLTIYHPFGKKSKFMGKFFNLGPFPVDGSIFTVNPTYFKISKGFQAQGGGASFRYIIDFGDPQKSKRILPGGISGNFMSPHYDDQMQLWLEGKYRPFVLDRKEVMKDKMGLLKLVPN